MSPNLGQALPQPSASMHDPPLTDTHHQPKEQEYKGEGFPTPKSNKNNTMSNLEEPESPGLEEGTAHASQSPQERSSGPMQEVHYQDASRGPCEAPWIYAMNELRSIQHSIVQLRSQVDEVETLFTM